MGEKQNPQNCISPANLYLSFMKELFTLMQRLIKLLQAGTEGTEHTAQVSKSIMMIQENYIYFSQEA